MNRIVASWDRSLKNRRSVPDALIVNGIKVSLNEDNQSGGKSMSFYATRKVGINHGAVKELAVYGPQDTVESLFRETSKTLKRLKTDASGVRALKTVGRFEGGRPSLFDIKKWLENLRFPTEVDSPEAAKAFNDDIKFMKKLHLTVRNRSHSSVIAEVEGS